MGVTQSGEIFQTAPKHVMKAYKEEVGIVPTPPRLDWEELVRQSDRKKKLESATSDLV